MSNKNFDNAKKKKKRWLAIRESALEVINNNSVLEVGSGMKKSENMVLASTSTNIEPVQSEVDEAAIHEEPDKSEDEQCQNKWWKPIKCRSLRENSKERIILVYVL